MRIYILSICYYGVVCCITLFESRSYLFQSTTYRYCIHQYPSIAETQDQINRLPIYYTHIYVLLQLCVYFISSQIRLSSRIRCICVCTCLLKCVSISIQPNSIFGKQNLSNIYILNNLSDTDSIPECTTKWMPTKWCKKITHICV